MPTVFHQTLSGLVDSESAAASFDELPDRVDLVAELVLGGEASRFAAEGVAFPGYGAADDDEDEEFFDDEDDDDDDDDDDFFDEDEEEDEDEEFEDDFLDDEDDDV